MPMAPPKRLGVTTTPGGDQVITAKMIMVKPRYDMIRVVGGAAMPNPFQFYVNPQGSAGDGFAQKTLAHTNQKQRNTLEKGVAIAVATIEVAIYAVGQGRNGDLAMRRVKALWEDAYVRFKVSDNIELEARLMSFAKGSGITGIPNMNAVAAETFVAPHPTIRGKRMLGRKIPLGARSLFEFELFWNENNTFLAADLGQGEDIAVQVALVGETSRPID